MTGLSAVLSCGGNRFLRRFCFFPLKHPFPACFFIFRRYTESIENTCWLFRTRATGGEGALFLLPLRAGFENAYREE